MSIPLPCPDSLLLRAIRHGTMEAGEAAQIEEHLKNCARCRTFMDLLTDDDAPVASAEMTILESESEGVAALPPQMFGTGTPEPDSATDCVEKLLAQVCEPPQVEGSIGRLGNYDVLELLGRGGMGAVFKCRDRRLDRLVAIKFLRPEFSLDTNFVDRFLREARTAAAINHNNVVKVYSVEEVGDQPCLVMEFIDGESLQQRLRRSGVLSVERVTRIGFQIAAGLAAAHERKVVHRDIKPENILLVGQSDQVKITDFGLAQADGAMRITRSGVLLGTPKFMAPEQARGEPVDHRSDLFSLGSVLYSMAAGQSPFQHQKAGQLLKAVASAQVVPIETINPKLPEWLIDIIRRLHQLRPDDRFQSAREVAKLLKAHVGRSSTPTSKSRSENTHATDSDDDTTMDEPQLEALQAARAAPVKKPSRESNKTAKTPVNHGSKRLQIGAATLLGATVLSAIFMWPKSPAEPPADATTKQQSAPEPVAVEDQAAPAKTPFRVIGTAQDERRFESLHAAYSAATPGSTVLIAVNGELEVPHLHIDKPIIFRADNGHHPILIQTIDDHLAGDVSLFSIQAPVVLEGLQFKLESPTIKDAQSADQSVPQMAIRIDGGELAMTHCRFQLLPGHRRQTAIFATQARRMHIHSCEFIGGRAIDWNASESGLLKIDQSAFLGFEALVFQAPERVPAPADIVRSTFLSDVAITVVMQNSSAKRSDIPISPRAVRINFRIEDSLFKAGESLLAVHPPARFPMQESAIQAVPTDIGRFVNWLGARNRYDVPKQFSVFKANDEVTVLVKSATDWQSLWFDRESAPQTVDIRFKENQPQVTPEMFHTASINDLKPHVADDAQQLMPYGADLSGIGPGKAYQEWANTEFADRWRRTQPVGPVPMNQGINRNPGFPN